MFKKDTENFHIHCAFLIYILSCFSHLQVTGRWKVMIQLELFRSSSGPPLGFLQDMWQGNPQPLISNTTKTQENLPYFNQSWQKWYCLISFYKKLMKISHFYCKIILNSTLRTSHPISGWVDATRCSKLKGEFPPMPPALSEGVVGNFNLWVRSPVSKRGQSIEFPQNWWVQELIYKNWWVFKALISWINV